MEIKRCEGWGEVSETGLIIAHPCASGSPVIAEWPGNNWYRFIRARYCPDCAIAAKRAQKRSSERRRRKERLEENRARQNRRMAERMAEEAALELAALRRQEAVLVRQRIQRLGGSTEWAGR